MAKKEQVVAFLKPIAERFDDVVQFKRNLVVKPVHSLLRRVCFDSTSTPYIYSPISHFTPLVFPQRQLFLTNGNWLFRHRPGPWDIVEPDATSDLEKTLDRHVLPFLRSVATFDDYMVFERQRFWGWRWTDYVDLKWFCVDLARGDFAAADTCLARLKTKSAHLQWQLFGSALSEVVEPLAPLVAARDRAGIAAKLREFEAISVKSLGLEALWEYQPFPIELQT